MKAKYTILGLSLALLLGSCGSGTKDNGDKAGADSLAVYNVEGAAVAPQMLDLSESFTATLEAKVKNNISAQTGGRLQQLYVSIGDRVSRGQVVARLEATQLATAQVQLGDAQLAYSRMDELYKIGGVSRAQWEQAKSALTIAQTQVNNLATNTALRSPISGVVTAKNYENGDMTSPTLPVVVIEQISPVKALIHVSETYYTKLKEGLGATLSVEALGDKVFAGKVSNIYPSIDSRTHTVTVEVEFPNAQLELRPGMYGSVKLDLGTREALMIPDRAVQRTLGAGTRYVYVIKGDKVEYRVVETGRKMGDMQEITSGLSAGEVVVTAGATGLTNGAKIKLSK